MARLIKILVHQNFIPHYRRRLFETLCGASDVEVTIASDIRGDSDGIAAVCPSDASLRWIRCDTRQLGFGLCVHCDMAGVIRRVTPDVVIINGNPHVLTAWILSIWGRIVNVPVLLWTHGLLRPETGLKGVIRRTFYRLGSGVLLYGDYAKTLLVQAGLDPAKLFVVYNSLDVEIQRKYLCEITECELDKFRVNTGVRDDERLVVFSGRLQANKKLDLLVEATGVLKRRGRTVHIVFIGDGNEMPALAEQAKGFGIASQVHFVGETYDEHVIATAFMASDLSVVPSGAGLSVMHALGYGVPVLLHDKPEEHFPEWEAVQNEKTGFFYRYGDVMDMANKMEEALFPTPRKVQMKEACLAIIQNRYSATSHAHAILSAVKQVSCRQK